MQGSLIVLLSSIVSGMLANHDVTHRKLDGSRLMPQPKGTWALSQGRDRMTVIGACRSESRAMFWSHDFHLPMLYSNAEKMTANRKNTAGMDIHSSDFSFLDDSHPGQL